MEHRWSRRNKVDFPVLIFENNLPVAIGSARNVSTGGLFIHTGPGWSPPAKLDLGLYSGENEVRLPCLVVHRTTSGVGVMFDENLPQTEALINHLLQDAEILPAPVFYRTG